MSYIKAEDFLQRIKGMFSVRQLDLIKAAVYECKKEGEESMNIEIKYHDPEIPKLKKMPQGDLIDLYAAETVELKKGDYKLISLGVSMKLPEGYKANVYPRSSTFKNWGIIQTNSVGQIDNSYCGDSDVWKYPVYAMANTTINKGDRICQFEIVPIMPNIEFNEVKHLPEQNRGGFGSTGK